MAAVSYELVGVPSTGTNPHRWKFGEPGCPLRLASTPTGLGGAPREHLRQKNARQAGATWRGLNDDINTIGLDVHVGPEYTSPGVDALDVHARWRDSLGRGDELGKFIVTSPRGERWQYVRFEDEKAPDIDTAGLEWNGYTREKVTLSSDQSFWFAKPVVETFTVAEFATASIRNSADVYSFAKYELDGPGTFTVGTLDEYHTLPAIGAGEKWVIETDRDNAYIHNAAGVDVWDTVGVKYWYDPIPARTTASLKLAVTGSTGATKATVTVPQFYARAL